MKLRISVMLAAAILSLSLNALAKDRLGAPVTLTLKTGRMLAGELYAVKSDALVLVDPGSRSVTVPIGDIVRIDLKKRIGRTVRTGAILGFLAGAVCGVKVVSIDDHGTVGIGGYTAAGALVGGVGAGIGALAGWAVAGPSRDKTYELEGLSGDALREVLSKLTKYARAPELR